MYKRGCPQCNKEINYASLDGLKTAEKKGSKCTECQYGKFIYFRSCPKCKEEMGYATEKYYKEGIKKKLCCRSCKNNTIEYKCQDCKKILTTKTHKAKFCPECKNKNSICYKPCFECGSQMSYANKYDMQIGIENNTVCQLCVNKRMSNHRKGKTNYDLLIAKGVPQAKAMNRWEASERKRLETRKGYRHSAETIEKILLSPFRRYAIKGLIVQGKWEKMFIEGCNDSNLPISAGKIKTPIGVYVPDFEYPDRLVEIKSTFTYEIFMGLREAGPKFSNAFSQQRDKIIWVGANIKPVQLLVLDNKGGILKEEWYCENRIKVVTDLLQKENPE